MSISDLIQIPSFLISFFATFVLIPRWMRQAKTINLMGKDMHKLNGEMLPEAGGIAVITGIFAGIFYYLVIRVCFLHDTNLIALVLGISASLLFIAVVGILDDLVGGWKQGLKQWQKPLLTIPAAIPFVLVNLKRTAIDIPIIGVSDLGILFPLLVVPVAIVGASNAFNMLAGYNGLEAGMGTIILATIGYLSFLNSEYFAVILCLIGCFALIAFLFYNWYPAKIFPGDTMTYPIGAFIAIVAVLGRVEKYGLILFIPYFCDFFLPLRKGLKVEAFAKVNKDGSFEPPYDKVYDSTHVAIFILKKLKRKVYERDVVLLILGFEVLLSIICILLRFLNP